MASITLHQFVERIRGRFGEFVVKERNGRMYISRRPNQEGRPAPTPAQLAVRNKFKLAAAYAKGALQDPATRLIYEQAAAIKQLPLFTVTASDFLNPPVVGLIDLSAYRGRAGDAVKIHATDDIGVVSVDVVIRASTGAIVEQGLATNVNEFWQYTATTALSAGQSVTFEVTAKDRPGQVGTQTKEYTHTNVS